MEGVIMVAAKGYAVQHKDDAFSPFGFERRKPESNDVLIDILYCGICHSDLHSVKNEWGRSIYPMVPGHEIIGKVREVGDKVSKFKVNDLVGVGCLINSCKHCPSCNDGLEQYCENGFTLTYNSMEEGSDVPTFGGYSNCIVAPEDFTLKIPSNLDISKAAPLLCAGITTYSPLKFWQVENANKVGIIGLGGLGHMGIKLAKAFGVETVLFTHSPHKEKDAYDLGVDDVIVTKDSTAFEKHLSSFDIILNTASAQLDMTDYLNTLKREGTLVFLGLPEHPITMHPGGLIMRRTNMAGSLIGGIKETQEMLDFCGKHNITADVEVIPIQKLNEAYERLQKGDVKYRFVIDMGTL